MRSRNPFAWYTIDSQNPYRFPDMRSRQSISSSRYFKPSKIKKRFPLWQVLLLVLVLGIAYLQLEAYLQQPQAILILGGAPEREVFAAEFARQHPDLPIWVSSGSNREFTDWAFSQAGISPSRLHVDYKAIDTVTNFTTLVDDFQDQGIHSLYLITSDYHMQRAQMIGMIVFGSRGIHFKPVSVPSKTSPESLDKVVRDGARAVLWVTTGHTGATLLHRFKEAQ